MNDVPIPASPLTLAPLAGKSLGWWGACCLIATEGAIFTYLLFTFYFFLSQSAPGWAPSAPALKLAGPNTVLLLLSSGMVWWAGRGIRRGSLATLVAGLGATIALGMIFIGVQLLEWSNKSFSISSGTYGALYFIITGFHMAHVAVGVLMLGAVLAWSLLRYFDAARTAPIEIAALYWHFVDVVWLAVFFAFYIVPRLMGAG